MEPQPQQLMDHSGQMESQHQPRCHDTTMQNQIESLKSNLQAHSMRLVEMCSKYTMESQLAETSHSRELKIISRLQKEICELEEKTEQTSLKLSAIKSNCQPLREKVEGTVQFGNALSEHRPRSKKSIAEVKMARAKEQAALTALETSVNVLLADFAGLKVKFDNDLLQLRKEVHTERETRISNINQHNQKVSEIEKQIQETQLLSYKEKAINTNYENATEKEHKQKLVLDNTCESMETKFRAEQSLANANLDEIQSRIPKHREGIEKGIAMKSDYQKLLPLMKELVIDQEDTKVLLDTVGKEKIQIDKKLEFSTNVKMGAELDISNTLEAIEKYAATEEAMRNSRVTLIEKLRQVEDTLAEKNIEKSGLEVYLQGLEETELNIDRSRKKLISERNVIEASIEKVNLDVEDSKGQLTETTSQISGLEKKMSVIIGEIRQVEVDNETIIAERLEIERALNETRNQIEQMLAAKVELVEQVEDIDSKLENINLEMVAINQSIAAAELDIQSVLNENAELEEKIIAAKSCSENLKCRILDEKAQLEALQDKINANKTEIDLTYANMEMVKADIELFTNDFKQITQLLESAELTKEIATTENCLIRKNLANAIEVKENKIAELKIIEDELSIKNALEATNVDQAGILHLLNLELAQEEEKSLSMKADFEKALEQKSMATEELLTKVAALEDQNDADSKAIAEAESDFNKNTAYKLEIINQLKELEESKAKARLNHEKSLQELAEGDKKSIDDRNLLGALQERYENAADECLALKEKVEELDLKAIELENALAIQKSNKEDDPELVEKNKKLKLEGSELEKALQEFSDNKVARRSEVRAVSKQWFAEMAALKEKLAREKIKIQELIPAMQSDANKKSQSPGTTPTAKRRCIGDQSSGGSMASVKNAAKKNSKEKSPRTPYKVKSPAAAGYSSKSPIISGSHKSPSSLSGTKVRNVELWNVNASSTPISMGNSNFQENLSPDEVENSQHDRSSSLKTKTKSKSSR